MTITLGQSVTIGWTSTRATSIVASGSWSGTKALSGSEVQTPTFAGVWTYILTATGPGGTTQNSVSVTVTATPPTLTFAVSPGTILLGESATLTWSSTDGTTATASGDWSGAQALNGSSIQTPLAAGSYTYTLTVVGSGGTIVRSVFVTVTDVPPTLTFTGVPDTLLLGESTTLTWSSTGGSTATASGAWSGSQALSGSSPQTPSTTGLATYTLTVTGPGGTVTKSVSITVNPQPAPTLSFTGVPDTITLGQTTTLSWTSTGGVTADASGGWSGAQALSGSSPQQPTSTGVTTYTLTITGLGGTITRSVAITVTPVVTPPPTLTFSGVPASITLGQSVTLTWSSTNATTATASGAWSGSKGVSGTSLQTPGSTGAVVYTLTVTGPGGTATQSVTITVDPVPPAPPTLSFSGSPTTITLGATVGLLWSSTNGTSAAASGAWSGAKTLNGSETVTPASVGLVTYTLTITGPGGTITVSVSITVNPVNPPPTGLSAVTVLTPGATTFGLALAQGLLTSGLGVRIGSTTAQLDVKTRWPDGTLRFGIVSAVGLTAGSYAIDAVAAPAGTLTPTWPTVVFQIVIGGQTWVATLGAFNGADSWLSGPYVREARVVVVPVFTGTPHPLLQVVFDVRSYSTGGHRIDVCVQNTRDVAVMDKVAASSATLLVGGVPVWNHGPVTTYSFTRWRFTYDANYTAAQIAPDFESAYVAGVLPRILSTVGNPTYNFAQPNYDVMGGRPTVGFPAFAFGEMNPDMGAGGGRQEIGFLCWWEASYLVHKTQNLRQAVLRNADLTGCWSNQLAKADGVSMIHLGDVGYSAGNWWWDARASAGNRPLAPLFAPTNFRGAREGLSADTDTGSAGVAAQYNAQHVPAPMFLAYLLSGDRYYVDQAKFWASSAILHKFAGWVATDSVNFPGWKRCRNGATGNERILDDDGMTREFGWPLRLLGMTAWMVPDTDADRTYLFDTVQNNLNHAAAYYDIWVTVGAGGTIGMIGGAESTAGWSAHLSGLETGRYTSTWRMAYTAYSLDWCTRQGLWTIPVSLSALIVRIVNMHIRMNIQNTGFLTGQSGLSHPYYPMINTMNGGTVTKWLDTFAELKSYNETYPYSDGCAAGACFNWNPNEPETGYYNVEHHGMLRIGVRRGLTDAASAASRLLSVPGHSGDLNTRAGFAITFS